MLVHTIFSPLDKFLSFFLFPNQVIDYLIAMCLPHGFIVTDPIAPGQLVPLLVSMFVLCWKPNMVHVQCAFSIYSRPLSLRILQPKVLEYSSGEFPLMFSSSPPLCLCLSMPLFSFTYSFVLTQSIPQRFFNAAVYRPEHWRVH